uniref:Uncharacterized protein n=1 Tax=Branchiostoma floridae TaxID=7739 RepID=C3ZB03_BRAFL|eukprot:XP_002594029.1 hypothetical protein BRAFLDRAFT_68531 [Branchiostoma floridae]
MRHWQYAGELQIVDEWLNSENVYKEFAPEVNFQTDVLQYLRRDVFAGDMGDLMILAVSHVLNIAIILITPDQDAPPQKCSTKGPVCILHLTKMHFDSTARISEYQKVNTSIWT